MYSMQLKQPTTVHCPVPNNPRPCSYNLESSSQCLVISVGIAPRVFRQQFCVLSSSPWCVLQVPQVLTSLICLSSDHKVKGTRLLYAVFSIHSLCFSLKYFSPARDFQIFMLKYQIPQPYETRSEICFIYLIIMTLDKILAKVMVEWLTVPASYLEGSGFVSRPGNRLS